MGMSRASGDAHGNTGVMSDMLEAAPSHLESVLPHGTMPASVVSAIKGQEGALPATAPGNVCCDIAQLPEQYQSSVLAQAYMIGLVSLQNLQQASLCISYPMILLGPKGTRLVEQIKRKVGMKNHSDKVGGSSAACSIYHQFNGRADEILKPTKTSDLEGPLKYQQALTMEREAAGHLSCLSI